jgi:hypothetical protein
MNPDQKREYWTGHLTAWKAGNQSQKAYCREHNLKIANLQYWRKRIFPADRKSKLIPVVIGPSVGLVTLTIGRVRIEIPPGLVDQVLPSVLRIANEVA